MSLQIPKELQQVVSPNVPVQDVQLEVDARELSCPLPLLKAKQGLRNINNGECIRVIATDAGSLKDFVSFARLTGQQIEGFYEGDATYYYIIRKQVL